MSLPLSVVIIAQDEERDLPACLDSVRGLDAEIVVLDGGSRDKTPELARAAGARVHARPFTSFTEQKQAALELAGREWALSLDADERVSPELACELAGLLRSRPALDGFLVPFRVHFMGRRLRFGGLGSERHLRLFRRGAGRFAGRSLHEGVEVRGGVGRLRGAIDHFPYRDIDEYLGKMMSYTALAAAGRLEERRRFTPLHHLLPAWEFFVRVVLRLGVLDGTPGLAWAGLSAFHTWVKLLKLRELQRTP